MNREEFKTWGDDFAKRFPDTGAYIRNLSLETRDLWFEEVFSNFELRDALAMNRTIDETGEGLAKYERDLLRGAFERLIRKQAYERETREIAAKQTRYADNFRKRLHADPVMGPMLAHVSERVRTFKNETGEIPPLEMVERWGYEAQKLYDTSPEDEETLPRYRCVKCLDKGLVRFTHDGTVFVGACPHCQEGRDKQAQKFKSGRQLGFAPTPAEVNPFNAALESLDDSLDLPVGDR